MAVYITIDGGTTNTRVSLVCDMKVVEILKYNVGARIGIDDKNTLKTTIKQAIEILISKHGMIPERILASGMITSEFGLYKLDHIVTPVGIKELHDSMKEVVLSEITNIPFVFIPGVKTECSDLEMADIMRGEETELVGIAVDGECVYVLPGSHCKIIYTDKKGRIEDFSTTLTGEMVSAISGNTILKDSVSFENATIVPYYLLKGYDYCLKRGINEALFKVRVLKNIFKAESDEIYSFFMGVILQSEINNIVSKAPNRVVIAGKKQIKEAIALLLKHNSHIEVNIVSDEKVDISSSVGMVNIYEY